MGRTKRTRKRKEIILIRDDLTNVFNLQKSMKLKCPKLEISFFKETGRGVRCRKKIAEKDILIALPLNQLITPQSDCQMFDILDFRDQSPQLILTTLLVYEVHLKNESQYFEYINSLPEVYTNLYFCSSSEVDILPLFLKKILKKQNDSIMTTFNGLTELLESKICPHCGTLLGIIFTLDKFIWAWFTVNTRSVYYEDETKSSSLALAPFLDMFNHSDKANTEMHIDFEKGVYTLTTHNSYKRFEQVFIKYGPHSNLKLLIEYGFVMPENPHDFVEFSFEEIIDSVKEYAFNYGEITKLKYHFIKDHKLNQNLSTNRDEFSWSLNGLLYVLITKDQILSVLQSKTYSNQFSLEECEKIKKIGEIITTRKYKELNDCFLRMDGVEKCTDSFKMVKSLMRIYLNLLKPENS